MSNNSIYFLIELLSIRNIIKLLNKPAKIKYKMPLLSPVPELNQLLLKSKMSDKIPTVSKLYRKSYTVLGKKMLFSGIITPDEPATLKFSNNR